MNNKRKAAALTALLLASLMLTACDIIEAIDRPGCPEDCKYTVKTHSCCCPNATATLEKLLEQRGFTPCKEEP